MKRNITILFAILISIISVNQTFSQEKIIPPSEGKAVIYFFRTNGVGALMNFRFFEKGKYIGKFKGRNYMRYECNPGKSVFWARAENVDFIETNFEANKVYFVEVNAVMGGLSAGARFYLVNYFDVKQMGRINKLLEDKEAKVFTDEELNEGQVENGIAIQKGMRKIHAKRKKGKKIKRIVPEMNYPL